MRWVDDLNIDLGRITVNLALPEGAQLYKLLTPTHPRVNISKS